MSATNTRRPKLARCALLCALSVPACVLAHKGGVDPYGCHPDDKAGGYHCHQGVLDGLSFRSRGAMLDGVDDRRRSPSSHPVAPSLAPPAYEALQVCNPLNSKEEQRTCFERITRPDR